LKLGLVDAQLIASFRMLDLFFAIFHHLGDFYKEKDGIEEIEL